MRGLQKDNCVLANWDSSVNMLVVILIDNQRVTNYFFKDLGAQDGISLLTLALTLPIVVD